MAGTDLGEVSDEISSCLLDVEDFIHVRLRDLFTDEEEDSKECTEVSNAGDENDPCEGRRFSIE